MLVKRSQYNGFSQVSALAIVAALGAAGPAFASGYGLREATSDSMGNAFSGGPAKAYDASTVWTNPAGMALLEDNEFTTGLSFIDPTVKFNGTATDPVTGGNVTGIMGHSNNNNIAPAASGASFFVFKLAPAWRLGFSLTAPFGQRIGYGDDFVGRYQSLVTSVTDINLGMALSYKVNDHVSIGGGPNFDYFNARLTSAIDTPLSPVTGQDAFADVHGNNIGFGYNLGVLYKFDDATRVGIDYRSQIRHNISGETKITVPSSYSVAPPLVAFLQHLNTGNRTNVTLPDSLSVGIYHQVTPKLALVGSVEWTDWSLFDKLDITHTNGTPSTIVYENWRNSWYVGVGANYQLTDKILLQGGFAYDESPVTDSNRTTRIPDSNRYDLGIGMQYKVLPSTTLQIAYLHLFSPGGSINNSAGAAAGTITGNYDLSANSVTAGLTAKF
ncbi:MAG TPA: OmpP1/FadL family transporter [Acidocella sp.]|nr:OmpP1/FadL family transporter [Acidocella sp.]